MRHFTNLYPDAGIADNTKDEGQGQHDGEEIVDQTTKRLAAVDVTPGRENEIMEALKAHRSTLVISARQLSISPRRTRYLAEAS